MAENLGDWTINYLPDEGGRFTGTLTLTADALTFVSLYESSNKTIVKAIFVDVGYVRGEWRTRRVPVLQRLGGAGRAAVESK